MKRIIVFALLLLGIQQGFSQNVFPSSGNVGIGTTTPAYNFQVQKTSMQPAMMISGAYSRSPRLQIYGLESDPNAWMGFGTDMGGGSYEHSIYFPGVQNYTSRLTIGDYNGSVYNTRMTVLSNGNIGIGTTNPGYKLDIAGNIRWGTVNPKLYTFSGQDHIGTYIEHVGETDQNSKLRLQTSYQGDQQNYSMFIIDPKYGFCFNSSGNSNGNVGIGTTTPTEKLSVNGNIRTRKVIVTQSGWPDYVFEPSYQLPSLDSVHNFIKENKHLPGMASAAIVEKEGLDLGEIVKQQQQKIEELMLYMIEMKKENEILKQRIQTIEQKK